MRHTLVNNSVGILASTLKFHSIQWNARTTSLPSIVSPRARHDRGAVPRRGANAGVQPCDAVFSASWKIFFSRNLSYWRPFNPCFGGSNCLVSGSKNSRRSAARTFVILSKVFSYESTFKVRKYLFVQYVYVVLHVYSGTHKQLLYTRTTIHELAYTYTFIGPTVTTNVQYHTSEGSFLSVFCTSGRKYGNRYLRTFVYVYCTLLTTYLFIRPSKVIRRY